MSSPERRRIVEAVREHARNAARTGSTHCPYKYCDERQWKEAYQRELEEIENEALQAQRTRVNDARKSLRDKIEDAETIEDLKSILLEMLP